MNIPRRVYYDTLTGAIIQITGGFFDTGYHEQPSIERDYEVYQKLTDRNRDTVGVIELEAGQFDQDFNNPHECAVNLETMELEFSYPDPSNPTPDTPVYQKPLSEQVKILEAQNGELMVAVAELAGANESNKIETQLAIAELASMITGGVA